MSGSYRYKTVLTSRLTRFTQLVDTPDSYTDQAGKVVAVNGDETELEFIDISQINLEFLNDQTVYSVPSGSAIGDFVQITGTGSAILADNTIPATLPTVGIIISKPSSTTGIIQTLGYADVYTGLVPGDVYFLGANGGITNVVPSTIGHAVYKVGIAKSSTRLELNFSLDPIILA